MKAMTITLLWCFVGAMICIWLLILGGCAQLVYERPDGSHLQINTFLTLTGFDGLYNDPAGFLEIRKYSGIPANIKLKFNPFLNQYEIAIESEAKNER